MFRAASLNSAIKLTLPLVIGWTISGCDTRPSSVREWNASDHDQPGAAAGQVTARPDSSGADPGLIDLAWRRNCVSCHGPIGRGDGPQGPMLRVPDLTRAEWQDRVSDDEIAAVVRDGRNKMPAFGNTLSPTLIDGIVQRIRRTKATE